MRLKLEKIDLDPLLIEWVQKQGIDTENKKITFKPHAGRKSNAGYYYIECIIEPANNTVPPVPKLSAETVPVKESEDTPARIFEDLERDNLDSIFKD